MPQLSNYLSLFGKPWASSQTLIRFHAPWRRCHTAAAPAAGKIVSVLFNFPAFAERGVTDTALGSALLERRGEEFSHAVVPNLSPTVLIRSNTGNRQRPVNIHHGTRYARGSRSGQKIRSVSSGELRGAPVWTGPLTPGGRTSKSRSRLES